MVIHHRALMWNITQVFIWQDFKVWSHAADGPASLVSSVHHVWRGPVCCVIFGTLVTGGSENPVASGCCWPHSTAVCFCSKSRHRFVSESCSAGTQRTRFGRISGLHIANMKELILSPCRLGRTQILRVKFECDLPVPRLPHVAQVWLSASLKAAYGNQLAQAQTVR